MPPDPPPFPPVAPPPAAPPPFGAPVPSGAGGNPLAAPLGVGDVLDGAFRLYRAQFGPLLLTATVVLAPLGLLSAVAVAPAQEAQIALLRALVADGATVDPALVDSGSPLGSLAICLLMPLQVAALFLARLALAQQAVDALHGRARALGDRLGEALRRLPGYAAMGCLTWFLIGTVVIGLGLAAAVALGVGLAALGVLANGTAMTVVAGVAVVGGVGLVVAGVMAAGLYLAGRWVSALPSLILVHPSPIGALDASWRLTARRPWRAAGFVALLLALSYVLQIIVATPLYLAVLVLPPAAGTALGVAIQALTAVVQIVLLPLWSAAVVVFHYDLRLRAERST